MRSSNGRGLPVTRASLCSLFDSAGRPPCREKARLTDAVENFLQHLPQYDAVSGLLDNLAHLLTNEVGAASHEVFLVEASAGLLARVRCHPSQRLLPLDGLALDSPLIRFFQTTPVHFLDLGAEPTEARPSELRAAAQQQLRTLGRELALPLVSRERLIGLLALGPKTARLPYDESEPIGLTLLARGAALTLDRLLEDEGLDLVGRVSHGLAHDISDLLTPISTCMQLEAVDALSRDKARSLLPLAMRNLDLVKCRIQHARRLAVEGELQFSSQRVDDLLREAVAGLQPELTRRAMTVTLDPLPVVVAEVDEVALLRVITNLLANAIHASPRGAQIRVELSAPEAASEAGAGVEFSIRDPGSGIDAEQLNQILAPAFMQEDAAAGSGSARRGLGLAICREIVALHGGRLRLSTALGRGTTVTVRLPLQNLSEYG